MPDARELPRWLFLAASAASSLAAQPTSTESVFRTDTTLIEIEVKVTDGHGHPVKGLTPAHFTLLEDGQSQEIAPFDYIPARGQYSARAATPSGPNRSGR